LSDDLPFDGAAWSTRRRAGDVIRHPITSPKEGAEA
jgi:hypothetical protein